MSLRNSSTAGWSGSVGPSVSSSRRTRSAPSRAGRPWRGSIRRRTFERRLLGPYFEEAAWIHDDEGIPIETIDASMRFRAGFPMGPFELADQVGIDVLHHLIQNAGRPMPRSVQALIADKKLGRKVEAGF